MAYSSFGGSGDEVQPGGSRQRSDSSQSQYFINPDRENTLANALSGLGVGSAQQFQDYIANPAASPMFQQTLQTMLSELAPGEDQARQNLQDQFRQAGALNSGAFANAARMNESDILTRRGVAATNLLQSQYAPTLQGLLGGVGQLNPLIANEKMSSGLSTSTGQSQAADPNAGRMTPTYQDAPFRGTSVRWG